MVGLVIVSHSAKLAEGVAELAREMGGPEVPIVTAGGTALPDAPLGTDAVMVAEAIQAAHSDSGVLVLMDLGSAVLSTEMALEMIPGDVRDDVTLCSAPLVEGAVAAATAARAGLPIERVADEARGGLRPKLEHIGDGVDIPPEAAFQTGPDDASIDLEVTNRLGLHARPASRLVRAASAFDARLSITNLSTGAGPASAQSLNSTVALGVRQGHRIKVGASGPDAAAALLAIADLASTGFGDGGSHSGEIGEKSVDEPEATLVASPASPGRAVGVARTFRTERPSTSREERVDAAEGRRRLEEAVAAAAADLTTLKERVAPAVGDEEAEIFDAQAMLLKDEELLGPARERIDAGAGPAAAMIDAGHDVAQGFFSLENPYIAARGEDVLEVCERVAARLLGSSFGAGPLEAEVVIVDHLGAADVAELDPSAVKAIIVATGGALTHASILLRALRIPAVVEAGDGIMDIPDGSVVGVDGDTGAVFVDPSSAMLARFNMITESGE